MFKRKNIYLTENRHLGLIFLHVLYGHDVSFHFLIAILIPHIFKIPLRKKCQNTEFYDTYFPVYEDNCRFLPYTRKYGSEETRILACFSQRNWFHLDQIPDLWTKTSYTLCTAKSSILPLTRLSSLIILRISIPSCWVFWWWLEKVPSKESNSLKLAIHQN